VYHEYVAFNEGRFPKTAKFKQIQINKSFASNSYSFPDVDNIQQIPKEALTQLRDFILEQRNPEDPTFCNTILTAVERVL
jgi:hypothetical protein